MNLRHTPWMSTTAYYANLAMLLTLPLHADWVSYLPVLAVLYFMGSLTITVGFHRLFCHRAFKTSPFWHRFFAIFGTLFMYGSPLQWSVTHSAHHRYSDTERDPHPTPWSWGALLKKEYRNVPLDIFRARRLLRQMPDLHYIVDRYYVAIFAALCALIALVDYKLLYLAVFPAIGLVQFVGGLHNTISHKNGQARDLWYLEYMLPAAGEWLHGTHHKKPGLWDMRTRWYHLDTGALLIKLIRT